MRWLDSASLWFALLCALQWLMIMPHELGHAAAARLVRFDQIRILVGSGRPIVSFNLLGVPWLFNLIPFGGLTLFREGSKPNRWKRFVVVTAGPVVNLTAAAGAWYFIVPGGLFEGAVTGTKLFFWANLIVLVENLVPRAVQTPLGTTGNDGLQLVCILFHWNKLVSGVPRRVPSWEILLRQFLKWTVFAITLAATLLFAFVVILPFLPSFQERAWARKIGLSGVMVTLALLAGWVTVRIAKEPAARTRKPTPGRDISRSGFVCSPEQQRSLEQAIDCFNRQDFAGAGALLDGVLASMLDPGSVIYTQTFLLKIQCLVSQNEIERAEQLCLDWVSRERSREEKLQVLDGFACHILYQPASPFLPIAERVARLALEIAPGALTLKGTLGAILAEESNFAEAELLLQDCLDRSPALHDQGISSYYLGVVKAGVGKLEEAKRFINRGMILHPEPWLLVKAKARLKELSEASPEP